MREIKFRAWDKTRQKMHDVGAIDFDNESIEIYSNNDAFTEREVRLDSVELMQFTGLKDRNGVEIFFGDIIEWSTTYFVNNRTETCRAVVEWSKTKQSWFPHINLTSKIIGNIYETPELLEATNKSEVTV